MRKCKRSAHREVYCFESKFWFWANTAKLIMFLEDNWTRS